MYHEQKCFIKIEIADDLPPSNYLKEIGFFDQWHKSRDWHIKPKLNTSFGIIKFNLKRIDSLTSLFSVFFQGHEQTRNKDITIARLVITEALNNIADHSIKRLGFAK